MKIENYGDVYNLLSFSKEECFGGTLITVKSTLFSDYIDKYACVSPCSDADVVKRVIPVAIKNYNSYIDNGGVQ